MQTYTIQEWLFKTAYGKFDLDLAESGIQFQTVKDIDINTDWILDYSTDQGHPRLRTIIADSYSDLGKENIVITHGGQESLYLLYRVLLEKEDHVITVSPGWQQSWEVPKEIGAEVSLLTWEPGEDFPVQQLLNTFKSNTKLLILNSPCNPIGSKISEEQWAKIIKICRENDIYILNDEEYLLDMSESIVGQYEKAFSVTSLSKVFGLPALRLGWTAGPKDIIDKMVNYKRYTSVCNSLLCENIAIGVLLNKEKHVSRYKRIIETATDELYKFAERNKEYINLVKPEGTPFAWFNLHANISSEEFCVKLLQEENMLIMPAEVFGHKNGLRITYGRELDLLQEGFTRIERLFARL